MIKHIKSRIATPVFVIAVTGILGACSMKMPSYEPSVLRNKITVAETVERLELYTGSAGLHLSARDKAAMGNFLAQYARTGEGPLYINVPTGVANSAGISKAQSAVRAQLSSMGLGGVHVQTGQYNSPPNAPAPVIISYRRLAIAPINCQQGSSLQHTYNNQPYLGFGCAQTANLAAMIDGPRQLLDPSEFDPAWANGRNRVMENFVKGEQTATERPQGQELGVQAAQTGGGQGGN